MLAQALLSALILGAPQAKISYKKKVMVDPNYKPALTRLQIEETLRQAAEVRVPDPAPQVVYETRRRSGWRLPIQVGLNLGYHSGHWAYGLSLGSAYDGLGLSFGYYGGHHRGGHHYRGYRGGGYRGSGHRGGGHRGRRR